MTRLNADHTYMARRCLWPLPVNRTMGASYALVPAFWA